MFPPSPPPAVSCSSSGGASTWAIHLRDCYLASAARVHPIVTSSPKVRPAVANHLCQQKMIRRKKNVKKGIQFCLMVCGASGTGMFVKLLASHAYYSLLRSLRHLSLRPLLLANLTLIAYFPSRPDHLCQHALQQDCASPQRLGRCQQRSRRGGCQDQTHHRRYVCTCQ